MRDIAIFLIAFLLLAFESPLLHEAHLAAYAPDMALLVVLYVGLSSRFERGLFLALGLGLLKDGFVMASPVGLYMVIMVIAFMVTYRLSQRLALRSILGVMLLAVVASFGASLLELFLSLVFDRHFGDSSRGPSLVFGAMLPEALVTAPFAPAVFWALDRLDGFLARKSDSVFH
ncbi:MAG: rod shape-determining protein MreD [Deltaproteobacteria bacterium]|nr:rod shape-determining protein MreD [Deltaproteobacteria bacterium]MCB9788183.1 rod shape-determining protein MreD [Deltaproteobacteria bacterium]